MSILSRKKGSFLLNMAGLVISITCCLLIFHFVSYEKSYDTFQPLSSRIVRPQLTILQGGKEQLRSAAIFPAVAPAMKKDFPEVEEYCRLHKVTLLLSNDEKDVRFNESAGFHADPAFINMFGIQVTRGDKFNLLNEPYQIMLSETMAKKYFGTDEAVGKQLTVRTPSFLQTYLVTGVFNNYPVNSHLEFDYLVSYSTYDKVLQHYGYPVRFAEDSWEFRDFYAYLQLKPGADPEQLQARLPAFCDRYINNRPERKKNNNHESLQLVPLKDIYLHSDYFNEAGVNGDGKAVAFLLLIAVFIIGIAWVNYINLSTAKSVERAKEVGVRKVLGAGRFDLIKEYFREGVLQNIAALLCSFLIAYVLATPFDRFAGKSMNVGTLLSGEYWLLFLTLFFTGTFLSAVYPAVIISSFNPKNVLKGWFKASPKGIALRKGLIVLQFTISIALIASTIIVYRQMQFMHKQPLGVNIDQTVVLQGAVSVNDSVYQNNFSLFKNELLRLTTVKTVSASTSVMGKEIAWTRNVQNLEVANAPAAPMYHVGIDYDFVPAYGLKIIAGRNFSREYSTDNKAVLLNETSVKLLGFNNPQEALNKKIKRSADTVTIAGVVADFHQQGLQKEIEPMIFLLMPDTRSFYSLKLQTGNMHKSIAGIESLWKTHFPSDPFNYFFLDDAFDQQYKADAYFEKTASVFALLAILISCFGLLGLSAHNVLKRKKEIGIRKILGAPVAGIALLLTKDFITLIAIAFIVASPLTWLVMHKWLQNFAYRTTIEWWVFVLAGIAAVAIAISSVSLQILKAAKTNPVKTLRTE